MAKVIDITDKLSFDENPKIKVKGKEYGVNADARTVLEIMGLLGDDNDNESGTSPATLLEVYNKLFSEADRKAIDKLKLLFKDLTVLIQTAISLVTGDDEGGEA